MPQSPSGNPPPPIVPVLGYRGAPPPVRRPPAWLVYVLMPLGLCLGGAVTLLSWYLRYHIPLTGEQILTIVYWTVGLDFTVSLTLIRMFLSLRRRISAAKLFAAPAWMCLASGFAVGAIRWFVPQYVPRFPNGGDLQLLWIFIVPVVAATAAAWLFVLREDAPVP